MDRETAAVIANTVDLARWCSERADDLDPLIDVTEFRGLTPLECRRVIRTHQELLRRVSQQQTFLAAMVFHRSAPWWAWVRSWLWGFAYQSQGKRSITP